MMPRAALVFGFVLGILSTAILYLGVNTLSAVLSVTAIAFYVFVYTMLLKRRTTKNIVWGGIAGCFPTLIGWTAVTGSLAWTPVVLFMVVFFWTPPHTWALALRYREDYANVDVPMLPVVASASEVGRQVVLYSWAMVATSLLLWPVADTGWFYPVAAVALLCLGGFAHQTLSVTIITLCSDLFPQDQVATATGVSGTAANLGVLLFTLTLGSLVDQVGYQPFFILLGLLDLAGAILLWTLVRKPA